MEIKEKSLIAATQTDAGFFNMEKELVKNIVTYLQNWFIVETEVGTKTNKTKNRIDIVIYHNSDTGKEYPIGIEVKKFTTKRGSEIGKWVKQAQRYCCSTEILIKPLMIIYPQISGNYFEEGLEMNKHDVFGASYFIKDVESSKPQDHNVGTFLFQIANIGELQKYRIHGNLNGLRIVINTYIIWDNNNPGYFNIDKYKKIKALYDKRIL